MRGETQGDRRHSRQALQRGKEERLDRANDADAAEISATGGQGAFDRGDDAGDCGDERKAA